MKTTFRHLIIASALASASFGGSAIELPGGACDGVTNCSQFTDFQVYSLALLNLQSNNAYEVKSTSGAIKDFVVVGINNPSTNVSGIDNPYNTPSANITSTFTTMTSDTTNGPTTGDGLSWQASMSALRTQFGNGKFYGFFAFNETGGGSTGTTLLDGGPDLLTWAKVTLKDVDANGNVIATRTFYLQPGGSTLNNNPLADPLPANTVTGNGDTGPWAYVHGTICTTGSGQNAVFAGYPDPVNGCPAGTSPTSQSTLGQDNAAFAIYNAELDAEVHNANSIYDVMQIDWQLAYINGGGETAWLQPFGTFEPPFQTPEPTALALMALGLLGIGLTTRGQQSARH
ncbi:MAG TPA: PEP-CTERM sorting domain-containing protein [Accumulibacter sp.]|jgi:hypothetical protein|nr:PEP-CTERM sorting domain-containing protein [Accumulibacter sp.]HQC81527.1 PEP-CTERM sorting domain-containing protein [Accumulibacter sp.]